MIVAKKLKGAGMKNTFEKYRIVFFGINEIILNVIRNEINPRKTEIVAFADNDSAKQGRNFMNIPVVALEEIKNDTVDVFVVAALSSYKIIKQQLMESGVNEKKIQPFITNNLGEYELGTLNQVDVQFIMQAYFEPHKMLQILEKYNQRQRQYQSIQPYSDNREEWFWKSNLISHACGGCVNGTQLMYSNSREAFLYSMKQGFKLVECDMMLMPDGELFLAHD